MEDTRNGTHKQEKFLTAEEVKLIIRRYTSSDDDVIINDYVTRHASTKMLGFLSDYWRLKVNVTCSNEKNEVLSFFIKVVSKSNAAKAVMVREMKLFQKETFFYNVLKVRMEVAGLKPWSARFVTAFDEVMVFEDLTALNYKVLDKFERFDIPHTLQALETLARFHASSIILEEKKTKLLGRTYVIHEEYEQFLDTGSYRKEDTWFQQCMKGALEAVKFFSKYGSDEESFELIKTKWSDLWFSTLHLSEFSYKYRNVICHRDLWNNNILFRYKKAGDIMVPDDCVLVDFAVVCCQPPAGDVMLLLCCNLDPKVREENINMFLNHYYNELKLVLSNSNIDIEDIITKADFFDSAEEQRQWGLILCACLLPQFWTDDDLMTEIFTDTTQFNEIMNNDKGSYIKNKMEVDQDYRDKVIEVFDEIVERYCLHASH